MDWPRKATSVGLLLSLSTCLAMAPRQNVPPETGANAPGRVSFHVDTVAVEYDTRTGMIDLLWKDGHRMTGLTSAAELADGTKISTSTYSRHEVTSQGAAGNTRGSATLEITFRSSAPGLPSLFQHLWLYPGKSWVTMDAELASDDKQIGTNHFDTLVVKGKNIVAAPQGASLRVLHVPFDNDMWFRWKSLPISEMKAGAQYTSQEVTTLYDNESRQGIVIGSVAHDTWKTAIDFAADEGELTSLDVYGGISSPTGERSDTHDFLPHGTVTGRHVTSPRIFIGSFSDWRDGLDSFGRFNAEGHPPLVWPEGAPIGWNSWAAYAGHINYKRYLASAAFVRDKLVPQGFGRRTVYVNLDAFWSNLDAAQLADAVANIKAMHGPDNMKFEPGIYWTPFSYWSDDLDSYVEGTHMKYRYRDIVLKGPDGAPLPKVDGGRAIDPSNPGALERIDFYMREFERLGFKYLKLDFLSHGALEGMHYDPTVQTGIEAYNLGMRRIVRDNDGRMFLSLSIAPLFPSGYGDARRLSCDTKGHISGRNQSTEYMLNALTYGWWTSGSLYIADPDHIVLGTKADEGARSVVEGRSRLLSAIITSGMLLDSSRLADDPQGQTLALQVYGNRNLMRVADEGKTFRPVEGDTGDSASDIFVRRTARGYYIALFNFDDKQKHTVSVDLDRIDERFCVLSARDVSTGEPVDVAHRKLSIELAPAASALIELNGKSIALVAASGGHF